MRGRVSLVSSRARGWTAAAALALALAPATAVAAADGGGPPAAAAAASAPVTRSTAAAKPSAAPAPVQRPAVASASAAGASTTTSPRAGVIAEPAPRPVAAVHVQSRFANKDKAFLVYGGAEYLSRGDFYNSPGARVGGTYYVLEPLGIEVQVSHYWSSLDATAAEAEKTYGLVPNSKPPTWLALAGARYSIGYGKLLVGWLGVLHFEPQVFLHGGVHDHGGDVGPSADAGLGLLLFVTSRVFVRADASVVFERETRSAETVSVWGTLPAISVGGML